MTPDSAAGLLVRVTEVERRMARVEDKIDGLTESKASRNDIEELRDEVQALRRVLITAAVSVSTSSVLFIVGILQMVNG